MLQSKHEPRHVPGTRGPLAGPAPDADLRLLIGRLCLAGLGRSPALDEQLRLISHMARSGLDPDRVRDLLDPLSRAVIGLDELGIGTAAVAPRPAPESTEIRDQRSQLLREKAEIETLLRQLDSRLEAIDAFFTLEEQQRSSTHDNTCRLNRLVLNEVNEISSDMGAVASLTELRSRVSTRLHVINGHIRDFRDHEDRRYAEHTSRTRALKARVEELERERRALHRSLHEEQRAALLDALTGIPNRAAWDERLRREFTHWQRHGGVVSLLVWDIDHFKSINDAHGHKAGDEMLRMLARHLKDSLRPCDFVARYGGEEFAMLLAGLSADDALRVANRVRAGVQHLDFHFHGTRLAVTVSCGVTTFRMGDTPDSAFERADSALYCAKDTSRNRCIAR